MYPMFSQILKQPTPAFNIYRQPDEEKKDMLGLLEIDFKVMEYNAKYPIKKSNYNPRRDNINFE